MFNTLFAPFAVPCTVYDPDETNARTTTAAVDNDTQMGRLGRVGDTATAYLPPDSDADAGDLLVVGVGSPLVITTDSPPIYYLVAKRRASTANTPGIRALVPRGPLQLLLMPLPYILTRRRLIAPPADGANIWNVPVPTEQDVLTIRAGESNANDPYQDEDIGSTPRDVVTFYTPLGADIKLQDYLVLPDGRPALVQQVNALSANGVRYALQLIVDASAGLSGTVGVP